MSRLPGLVALALIALLVGVALGGLIAAGGDGPGMAWPQIGTLLRSAAIQASLSALTSVAVGAAIALALARRPAFRGRTALIVALNVATVLPAIVTVFAVVTVLGRSGWLGDLGRLVGIDTGSWIYGLDGVLIAHLVLNAPLAARIFLAGLAAVPAEQWRLAAHLGMPPGAVFRLVDWPVLHREIPAVAVLVFLACFSSFAIVLALGGGPRVSTLEVAVYEAVRFEADFRRAGLLALVQIAACAALLGPLMLVFGRRLPELTTSGIAAERPDRAARGLRRLDAAIIAFAILLVGLPLAGVLAAGVGGLAGLVDRAMLRALATSLGIGAAAGILSVLVALALSSLGRSLRAGTGRRLADVVGLAALLLLVVSPIAFSAGLFVALRPVVNPYAVGLPLIVIVNALMALPFTYRQVEPPLLLAGERYGRLADSLGLRGFHRLRLADWPLLRGPLIVALAMATALSLGDLGVAAFFRSEQLVTLPLLLFERLGAYRTAEAASVALVLTALCAILFLLAQRWSAGGALAGRR